MHSSCRTSYSSLESVLSFDFSRLSSVLLIEIYDTPIISVITSITIASPTRILHSIDKPLNLYRTKKPKDMPSAEKVVKNHPNRFDKLSLLLLMPQIPMFTSAITNTITKLIIPNDISLTSSSVIPTPIKMSPSANYVREAYSAKLCYSYIILQLRIFFKLC